MRKLVSTVTFLCLFYPTIHAVETDSLSYAPFGKLMIYGNIKDPSSVILYIGGDGGWNRGEIRMVEPLLSLNTLVVGIDILKYVEHLKTLQSACYYPAGDFENLSKFIQKRYGLRKYITPILIGHSSGATLAYGILAQSPENTFKGAFGFGFCPDIEIPKPLCKGSGLECVKRVNKKGYDLMPSPLTSPFVAMAGQLDLVCGASNVKEFVAKTPKAELILLPKVGHGFANEKNWLPQFTVAYQKMTDAFDSKKIALKPSAPAMDIPRPGEVNELPLKVINSGKTRYSTLVFMISGDGGWTGFDQNIADHLSAKSYPVVGLDALQYFWSEKSPEKITSDCSSVMNYYLKVWGCDNIILFGYSFGADVMPFLANRLSMDLGNKIKLITLLSPDESADFEIHVADMLHLGGSKEKYDVINQVAKLKKKTLLMFGSQEEHSAFNNFRAHPYRQVILPGGHHFGDDFDGIVNNIVNSLND